MSLLGVYPARPLARARTLGAEKRTLVITTFALGASGSTTLAFNIVMAHVMGAAPFGDIARTFSVGMGVAQLTMAGVAPAFALSVATGQHDKDRLRRARAVLLPLAATTALASLLYLPLARLGAAPGDPVMLISGWALAFIYALYFGLKLVLFVLDWSTRYAVLELTSDAIFFVALALLAAVDPAAGVLAFSIAYGLFIALTVISIMRRSSGKVEVSIDGVFRRYAGLASIATYASFGRFPLTIALTGVLGTPAAAGHVAPILSLITPLFLLPQAASVITFASVARSAGADPTQQVRRMVATVAGFSALAVIACAVLAPEIIRLLLPPRYTDMTVPLVLVAAGLAPQLAAMPVYQAIAGAGEAALNAALAIAGMVALVVVLSVLVPNHGASGAATAFGASMLFTGSAGLLVGWRRYRLRRSDLAGLWLAPIVACGLAALVDSPLYLRVSVGLVAVMAWGGVMGSTATAATGLDRVRK